MTENDVREFCINLREAMLAALAKGELVAVDDPGLTAGKVVVAFGEPAEEPPSMEEARA